MLHLRRAEDRGHADHGWLDTHHTFSFAGYYDPRHMGLGPLRVINDDTVAPGAGFPAHRHRDMEIISYVLEGALEHADSTGTGSVIRPGDVQRMSAGTGVTHSEYNASDAEPVHFLQIWIEPERSGLPPSYEQKHFPERERRGRLRLVASRDGAGDSVRIHQDARLFAALLDPGQTVTHRFAAGRGGWLHLARGSAELGGTVLHAGDGAAILDEDQIALRATEPAELLLFELVA